ncbi:MAG TPA: hypothetical protein VM325_00915 [Alphaproteobacteria bacterium]|nr:hypothetical protein [Alphaproteobacteria bacterium]
MALALTIFAIVLASLALGVQLADLRVARGGRVRLSRGLVAGNDNDLAAAADAITAVRPKIVSASITRRCAHR